MKKFLETIKQAASFHRWIIIGAFSLTLLIFLPWLIFPGAAGREYQGININHFGTDAHFYLTRGAEVRDGHGLGNPLLREGKEAPDSFSSYSEYILLAPLKLLGLSQRIDIVSVYNIYNFIGIFALILLIYGFVYQLSRRRLLSAAAALFVIGGYSIIYWKTLFYNDFNIYARSLNPYVSSLAFFLYLNLLVKSLRSDKLGPKIFTAAAFGLLCYVYFFAWSFALAVNASLGLVCLFKKDFTAVKNILLISLLGLLLGAYNLAGLMMSFFSDWGKQIAYFNWMSAGHAPVFSKIGFLTLLLAAIFAWRKKGDENLPLILGLIGGGWLALNQQIITGRLLQYGHYYWYFIVPLSIIAGFYMVWFLIKNESLKKRLFLLAVALTFINTAGGQYQSFFTTLEAKRYEQNFRPFIDYLNRDKKPAVILAGDQANEYLFTIYTPHDVFWHTAASFSRTPLQRFKDALFVYSYLNKDIRNDFIGYYMKMDSAGDGDSFYYDLYRNLEGYWSGLSYDEYNARLAAGDKDLARERSEIVEQLNAEYAATVLPAGGLSGLLKKYGVNYIVWDKNKNPEWEITGAGNFEPVVEKNNIYLYRLVE